MELNDKTDKKGRRFGPLSLIWEGQHVRKRKQTQRTTRLLNGQGSKLFLSLGALALLTIIGGAVLPAQKVTISYAEPTPVPVPAEGNGDEAGAAGPDQAAGDQPPAQGPTEEPAPTDEAAGEPTEEPTEGATEPAGEPTEEPTEELTEEPASTEEVTEEPTLTDEPALEETIEPTAEPSIEPTETPPPPSVEPEEAPALVAPRIDVDEAYTRYVNVGRCDGVQWNGANWEADQAYEPGGWGYVGPDYNGRSPDFSMIFNRTGEPESDNAQYLHRCRAFGEQFGYRFDVPNGSYLVRLRFVEPLREPGKRQFDVSVEGQQVLDNFDIAAEAGGVGIAIERAYEVEVSDNQLAIDFFGISSMPDPRAIVQAIAVLDSDVAPPPPIPAEPPTTDNPTEEPTEEPTGEPANGLMFEAESGDIQSPFEVAGGYIIQRVDVSGGEDIARSGRATYIFNVDTTGSYVVKALVNARDDSQNSVYVAIDAQPTAPLNIWDVDVTKGFEERTVSWRGSGTYDDSEFDPVIFSLTAGEHTLVLAGREANTRIDRIWLEQVDAGSQGDETPTPEPTEEPTVEPGSYAQNVNAGQCGAVSWAGIDWSADQPYTAGGWGHVGADYNPVDASIVDPVRAITGAHYGDAGQELHRCQVYGENFGYHFDVPSGDYAIHLRFADPVHEAGQRMFDVIVEDSLLLNDFDVAAEAGGPSIAIERSFTVTVTDGQLNIDFVGAQPGSTDPNALVQAIRVATLDVDSGSIAPPEAEPTEEPTAEPTTPVPTAEPTDEPDTPASGLTFEAESGDVRSPFQVASGYVFQEIDTTGRRGVSRGGRATYTFNVDTAGSYVIGALVNAPNGGQNSFYVAIDSLPANPANIWDIDPTDGFEQRTVSWRGSGSASNDEFDPVVFSLTAGPHTLVVVGREDNTRIDRIWLEPVDSDSPGDETSTPEPTEEPTTPAPTDEPTEEPTTPAPTEEPTIEPTTPVPTAEPTEEPTDEPDDPAPGYATYVNVGRCSEIAWGGVVWAADQPYNGNSWGYVGPDYNPRLPGYDLIVDDSGQPMSENAQYLHRCRAFGQSFGYRFDVTEADYIVRLRFVEPLRQPGQRLFDVNIEGYTALDDFDIAAEAGGTARIVERAFLVAVTDGQLNIQFEGVRGSFDENAVVQAIAVTSADGSAPPSSDQPGTEPTAEPTTPAPTEEPTIEPTTPAPTEEPTLEPTTPVPTEEPTLEPTTPVPTEEPVGGGDTVFATGFENASMLNTHHMDIDLDNWFEYGGDGGAEVWMDSSRTHNGGRSVGMKLYDIRQSRRVEFDIYPQAMVGDDYTVSAWYYLPADWSLNVPGIDWNWYALIALYSEYQDNYDNYVELHIGQPDISRDQFNLSLFQRRSGNGTQNIATVRNFPLPRGRWFHVQYYVKRHPTNGVIKVWIDGQLIFDESGLTTKAQNDYYVTLAKIYHDPRDEVTHQVWVDDMAIYDGLVAPR
jgi:hypothetical protein